MALRKKNNRKRAPRRKAMRKRRTNPKPPVRVNQLQTVNNFIPKPQVFHKTALSTLSGASIIGTGQPVSILGGALASSMPDWASIIQIYNRYKMLKVKYTFNLQGTGGNTLFTIDLPKMIIRYNYDSNLTAAGVHAKLQDVANVQQFQFTPQQTSFSYTYYPRCVEPVYLSTVATGYKLARQQYIDTQYGAVPHYGIMWYLDNLATGLILTYDVSYETAFKYQN